MPVVIGLLRGVNLGPHRRIKMEDLRAVCKQCKLRDAQTYLQSGNIVFRSDDADLPQLAKRVEDAIEASFGFRSDCILRTTGELRGVVSGNPFAGRKGVEPARLLVTFLASTPNDEACARVRALRADSEEVHLAGSEIYIYYPNGMGRSKLTIAALDRALKISGTGRNWNTVTQLMEIAESLAATE